MRDLCLTCPLPCPIDLAIEQAGLTSIEAVTLQAIAQENGSWITAHKIAARIFTASERGPLVTAAGISHEVRVIRRKVKSSDAPLRIESHFTHGYRLVWTERNAA